MSNAHWQMSSQPKIVILGGGIHGVCTAYYLATKYRLPCTIVEQTAVASAASGKAGGFLARDWGDPSNTAPLHELSYELHKSLSAELGIASFREIQTFGVDAARRVKRKSLVTWLDGQVSCSPLDGATAQVTPLEFTEKVLRAALSAGCELLIDRAEGVIVEDGKVKGVKLKERGDFAADKLVICLGPWSGVALEDWFDIPLSIEGIKSSSMVFQDVQPIVDEPIACFCEEDKNGCHLELYPRNNGELYICGLGGSDHVRGDRLRVGGDCADSDLIDASTARVKAACASLRSMSSYFEAKEPNITQACMRPCTPDALPVMDAIPHAEGAFVSAGHNCWGILWGPGSGLCMAELVATGKCTRIDLSPFTIRRFHSSEEGKRGRKMVHAAIGEQW